MDFPKIKVSKILQCRDCVHCDERGKDQKEAYCYQRRELVNPKATACKNVDVQRRKAQ